MSTSATPEQRNSQPMPSTTIGGHLRASDADRDQVVTVLSTAYAEGRLTREEHDERLEQVWQAKTFDDLIPITHDLVVVAPSTPRPSQQPMPTPNIQPHNAIDEPDRLVGIFGGCVRKGSWRIRRQIQSMALFGGIDLDMTQASFDGPVIEVSGFWCFGGLDITVPHGVEVRDQTVGIFGGTDISRIGEPTPGAPILVIKGLTLFGGVSVHGPKPERGWKRTRHQRSC